MVTVICHIYSSQVETEIADVIVRDVTAAQTHQNPQAVSEGQRFPNGKRRSNIFPCVWRE